MALAQAFSIPDFAATGGRALNVQSYVESNTKLGSQFYLQISVPTLAASGTYNITFTTGS